MAERFRGTGVILRFIEYMDVGATNGWRLDEVVPSAEIVSAIDARWPLEPVDPAYRGEVAVALPLPRRRGRDRPDLVGHAAVLPRLHARAAVGRGQALHLPVREPRPRPARAACAASDLGRRARRAAARPLARARRPLLGAAHAGHAASTCPGSRCRTSAAERRRSARVASARRRAAPCGPARGASPRRRAPRARPDAARAARPWRRAPRSARRVASASGAGRGVHQGHDRKVRQARGISEIVICDVNDKL